MEKLKTRLDRLWDLIQSEDFLEGRGLSNEVNIRIFCYAPEEEMQVRAFVRSLQEAEDLCCRVVVCNLFRLFLSICDDMAITEAIPDMEEMDGRDFLLDQLRSAVDTRALVEKMEPDSFRSGDVLLLTGVGEVYPFIRIHTLLEAMQPRFPDTPILVLYPGEFDRYRTRLFNRLAPHDYYRAFRVL